MVEGIEEEEEGFQGQGGEGGWVGRWFVGCFGSEEDEILGEDLCNGWVGGLVGWWEGGLVEEEEVGGWDVSLSLFAVPYTRTLIGDR